MKMSGGERGASSVREKNKVPLMAARAGAGDQGESLFLNACPLHMTSQA